LADDMKIEAIFIDRDGTINQKRGEADIIEWKKFKFLKKSIDAIKIFNSLKLPVIVVTNQPAVAKGFCTINDIKKMNKKMEYELRRNGAKVSAIYFCPHHPEKGWPGENKRYKIKCSCRKPKIGMLLKAKKRFKLNLKNCFMIGDTTTDIKTGLNAGCKTILVKTGKGGRDGKFKVKPHYVCSNLYQAARLIQKMMKK